MTRTARYGAAALLAAGLAVVLLSGGCAAKIPEAVQQPVATAPTGAAIPRMTADEKRSMIASSFPIEVPVPQGRVVRGEAQGEDVWDYQLEVTAAAADAASWYLTWYPKAEWRLVSDEPVGAGRRLVFVKGGYAADVTLTPGGQNLTKVTAIVGLGDPVLNTQ